MLSQQILDASQQPAARVSPARRVADQGNPERLVVGTIARDARRERFRSSGLALEAPGEWWGG
jgi:hypothetical protein